jgi:hypothetical protein
MQTSEQVYITSDIVGSILTSDSCEKSQAHFRRRIFHVPNLIDELGTAEERRMNQLSTAEFGAAKARHKFGRACRIMRRWSDIDSYAAPLMCQT